jgi:hypothetical protein
LKPYQYGPIIRAYNRRTFLTKAFIIVTVVPIMLVQQIWAAALILILALVPLYGLYALIEWLI